MRRIVKADSFCDNTEKAGFRLDRFAFRRLLIDEGSNLTGNGVVKMTDG